MSIDIDNGSPATAARLSSGEETAPGAHTGHGPGSEGHTRGSEGHALGSEGHAPGSKDHASAFSHRALFYADLEGFLAGTAPFVRAAVEREEPVMVAVTAPRRAALQDELDDAAQLVRFVQMESLGANPARIIPAWRRFVADNTSPSQPVRGIGEPIWPAREQAELVECQRHESLLNLAFADSPPWQLLCPYDTSSLDDATLAGACQTHPHLACSEGQDLQDSPHYVSPHHAPDPFSGELPEPGGDMLESPFDIGRLAAVRGLVATHALQAGLGPSRRADLVLAVDELATNSIRHGGGEGTLRIWREPDRIVCEVRDDGLIGDPLAGRREPASHQQCGRGMWIVNQVCDLVQVRSGAHPDMRTVVRLHMRI